MTLSIQTEENNDNMLVQIETMQKQVKALMVTKHYTQLGEAGVFAILQKAKSLNMNPIEALNGGLYFVSGKVGMSTESMASMIRSKGHSIIKDPKSDNNTCILHGRRADNGDTWTCSFSVDDAKRAGLFKNVFEKYPAVMCYNRACSMLARQLFPDVIKGAGYTFDELKEIAESKSSSFTPQPSIEMQVELQPVETISFDQAEEILLVLDQCDPDYKKRVLDFIKQPPYACQSLFDLPKSLYVKVKTGATEKRKEWMLKQESVVQVVDSKEESE